MNKQFTALELNKFYDQYDSELCFENMYRDESFTNEQVANLAMLKAAYKTKFFINDLVINDFIDYGVQYLIEHEGSTRA